MKNEKPTLVLGASLKPQRFAHRAILMLRRFGHPVYALGLRQGEVADVQVETAAEELKMPDLDTVTLYMNPKRQEPWYEQIIAWQPQRVIFNPGTENPELMSRLREANIEPVQACTLVMLQTQQY